MILSRLNDWEVEVGEDRRLCLYAALYNVPTLITEGTRSYYEVILPGAFDESLRNGDEVIGNINHENRHAFAKRSDGSLLLQSDDKGLFATAYLPATEPGEHVIRAKEQKRIKGTSFQFDTVKSRTRPDGVVERVKVKLIDVCVAIDMEPAYPQTRNEVHIRTKKDYSTLISRFRFQKWKLDV